MRLAIPITAGAVVGFALWLGSPGLVGSPHPWEAKSALILACLFVVGAVLGAAWPDRPWTGPLGLYVGQGLALAGQKAWLPASGPSEPLFLAVLFLVQYSLPGLAGAGLGALLADVATGGLAAWISAGDRDQHPL